MELRNISQIHKNYVNTLLIEDGRIHYFPYIIGINKKNKSFWNYKNVINLNEIENYLTDKMKKFMEDTNTVLIKNSNGFLHYNPDKKEILNHIKLNKIINNYENK